ncbi:hypothetical protein AC579_8801 [Pseudocercospora musae]|uniref:Amino acid permease/ SLC12A domain-containing protein n=2 Tax=Pseudocercospora musae TaxID=113226 RepID=A0A139HAC5_9PEZI|nr:hypothetical protein AC579_8801 [Pseudocercospora musae]
MDPVHVPHSVKSEKPRCVEAHVNSTRQHSQGRPEMATIHDDDERLLAQIGYKQELRREFTRWSTISYAISILGVLGSQPATYGVPISVGGPATAVWAWFIGSIMAYVIATSVSELVSAYPTAGGMYFVTKKVVPEDKVPIWAWCIGWCNFLGQACGVASIAYTIGQMVLAGVSMNSGMLGDGSYTYSPKPWTTVVVAIICLFIFAIICSLTTKKLHQIILWFAPINLLATIIIGVVLLVYTARTESGLRTAQFVFCDFRDLSGWGSTVFSFLLGFLNVAWVMTDYDATTHMSEETHDAGIQGPRAIRFAIITAGLQGWFLNIVFTFCLTENYMEDIVGSPTGLPVAQIFLNAVGNRGGSAMLAMVLLIQFFTGASAMLANARMAYAFARDEALPFSDQFSEIWEWSGTPVKAVWLVAFFCMALNLIGIGSTQTITAIFNLCAPCLDLSYVAVIAARRFYHLPTIETGKYTLGWKSLPLNILAIVWVGFISIVLFFPPIYPVTALNMNYAVAVAAFVAIFALSWWWLGARHRYTGPRTIDIMENVPVVDPDEHPPHYQHTSSYGSISPDLEAESHLQPKAFSSQDSSDHEAIASSRHSRSSM